MKLYSLYTPSHRVLKERFFDPTVPPGVDLRMEFFDSEGEGLIQDVSWRRAIIRKVDLILEAIKESAREPFVFSDVDIQFFAPFETWFEEALRDHDMAFQIDAPGPCLCTGFFFCRGSDATRSIWQRVREHVRATDARDDDQATLRRLIGEAADLRWTFLPPVFCGGGTCTGRYWQPGCELPVPEGIVMHHANFTCGVPNKVRQCEHVREILRERKWITLQDAIERTRSRAAANAANSHLTVQNSRSADFPALLRAVAAEPGFHPYAAESETAEFLAALVGLLGARHVLELGTHKGFTTLHLLRALSAREGARLVTVDRQDQRSRIVRELEPGYTFIHGHDLEVIPQIAGMFDMVFVDTTHEYEHTRAEIQAVLAHSPKAVIALHDAISCPGVKQAIAEFSASYDAVVLPTAPHPTLRWVNGLAILHPRI